MSALLVISFAEDRSKYKEDSWTSCLTLPDRISISLSVNCSLKLKTDSKGT